MTEMPTPKSFAIGYAYAKLVRSCSPLLLLVTLGAYYILFILAPVTPKYNFENLSIDQLTFQQELLAEKRGRVEIIRGERGTFYLLRDKNPKKQTWAFERPTFLDKNNNPILEPADMKSVAEQELIARPVWILSGPEIITIAERNGKLSLVKKYAASATCFLLLLIVSATMIARPVKAKTGDNFGVEIPELLGFTFVTGLLTAWASSNFASMGEFSSGALFASAVVVTILYWQSLLRQFTKASSN